MLKHRLLNLFVRMRDGCHLAVRIWLPETAERVSTILECNPYRFIDGTSHIDSTIHPRFASYGYAAIRADTRGSGNSEGLMRDEYSEEELNDTMDLLEWIAAQSWSNGKVGMMGISWGGFLALQVAALRPPQLHAIITVDFSDDRYADDIHYMGGCLLTQNFGWSMAMTAFNSRPPDPEIVGERWREQWIQRLRQNRPFIADWLKHQRRDEHWRRGSVCEDYANVQVPVYAMSGWHDPYSNSVPRIIANLQSPRKGLIGPWAHQYPHLAIPGPRIGFVQECLKWWDCWLKNENGGIANEPQYRVWMQAAPGADAYHRERAGEWIEERSWPSAKVGIRSYRLSNACLVAEPDEPARGPPIIIHTPQHLGSAAGAWCPIGRNDLPEDQQRDDRLSIVFETERLDAPFEILGAPELQLCFACDRSTAYLCARLCDVAPGGSSYLISYGLLNLTHWRGHDLPQRLQPGKSYHGVLRLNDAAHRFCRGHRVRLALSSTFWPLVWPSPQSATVTLNREEIMLMLPERTGRQHGTMPRDLGEPDSRHEESWEIFEESRSIRRSWADPDSELARTEAIQDTGLARHLRAGLVKREIMRESYSIGASDPLSAEMQCHWTTYRKHGEWEARTESRGTMSASRTEFRLSVTVEALEREREVERVGWDFRIPRDWV